MKTIAIAILFLCMGLQPLYAEYLTEENTYATNFMAQKTYFAGASSVEKDKEPVRKPASLEKKTFYQKYLESKEDRFGYIFQ